jgi:hypothetical protein
MNGWSGGLFPMQARYTIHCVKIPGMCVHLKVTISLWMRRENAHFDSMSF